MKKFIKISFIIEDIFENILSKRIETQKKNEGRKELEKQYIVDKIDNFIDNIKIQLQDENASYSLIYEGKATVTEKEYDVYQLLYENDNNETLITVIKRNDKLFIIQYTAENKYFDMLLDNVKNMLWSFEILDQV